MFVPHAVDLSVGATQKLGETGAACHDISVRIFYSDRTDELSWAVCLFIRPAGEPLVILQSADWAPEHILCARLAGEGPGPEVQVFEGFSIEQQALQPEGRAYDVYAVALPESKVRQLANRLRRDSYGQPYLVNIEEIEIYEQRAVISPAVRIDLSQEALSGRAA